MCQKRFWPYRTKLKWNMLLYASALLDPLLILSVSALSFWHPASSCSSWFSCVPGNVLTPFNLNPIHTITMDVVCIWKLLALNSNKYQWLSYGRMISVPMILIASRIYGSAWLQYLRFDWFSSKPMMKIFQLHANFSPQVFWAIPQISHWCLCWYTHLFPLVACYGCPHSHTAVSSQTPQNFDTHLVAFYLISFFVLIFYFYSYSKEFISSLVLCISAIAPFFLINRFFLEPFYVYRTIDQKVKRVPLYSSSQHSFSYY